MYKKNDLIASCGLGLKGTIAPDNYQNIASVENQEFLLLMKKENTKINEKSKEFVAELGKAPEGFPTYEWILNHYLSPYPLSLNVLITIRFTQDEKAYDFFQYGNWLKYTPQTIGTNEVIAITSNTEGEELYQDSTPQLKILDTGENAGVVYILKNTGDISIARAETMELQGYLMYRPNGTLYLTGSFIGVRPS